MIMSAWLDFGTNGTNYIKFLYQDCARIWNFSFKVYPKEEFGQKSSVLLHFFNLAPGF